jgi:hypothetical protein
MGSDSWDVLDACKIVEHGLSVALAARLDYVFRTDHHVVSSRCLSGETIGFIAIVR